jgi:hypothetical protein
MFKCEKEQLEVNWEYKHKDYSNDTISPFEDELETLIAELSDAKVNNSCFFFEEI